MYAYLAAEIIPAVVVIIVEVTATELFIASANDGNGDIDPSGWHGLKCCDQFAEVFISEWLLRSLFRKIPYTGKWVDIDGRRWLAGQMTIVTKEGRRQVDCCGSWSAPFDIHEIWGHRNRDSEKQCRLAVIDMRSTEMTRANIVELSQCSEKKLFGDNVAS